VDRLRKRFVTLTVPVALILFASFLAAQGPPGCANVCWQKYTSDVKACHGDPGCLDKRTCSSSGLRRGLRPATVIYLSGRCTRGI
jgi:hypothetical protein